jgi:hypothetical protein
MKCARLVARPVLRAVTPRQTCRPCMTALLPLPLVPETRVTWGLRGRGRQRYSQGLKGESLVDLSVGFSRMLKHSFQTALPPMDQSGGGASNMALLPLLGL